MKQLVVLSGKGGTGKTTVTAALAHLASQEIPLVIADADVDAANLELLLSPSLQEEQDFISGQIAVIDEELCTGCGTCESICRFDAVQFPTDPSSGIAFRIDPSACEGCAACMYPCPSEAIRMESRLSGQWFRSETPFGPLFHAHLFAGQENSGKLVTLVKQQARQLASDEGRPLLLVDGPPGIGCPVISSLSGADLALLVTEPTVSGVHDLERILGTARHFGVPSLALINKADINTSLADALENICRSQGIDVLERIPYDPAVTEAMVHGQPVTTFVNNGVTDVLKLAWNYVNKRLLAAEPMVV
jgi:MinD superfamily P-loop ATPase